MLKNGKHFYKFNRPCEMELKRWVDSQVAQSVGAPTKFIVVEKLLLTMQDITIQHDL